MKFKFVVFRLLSLAVHVLVTFTKNDDKSDRGSHTFATYHHGKYPFDLIPSHPAYKPIRLPAMTLASITTSTTTPLPTAATVPFVSINCNRNQVEPDATDEYATLYFLEKAKDSLSYYQERVLQELEALRDRDREMNENLSRASHVVASNDRELGSCRASLGAMESTLNEVFSREKDSEQKATQLEEENGHLREKLRGFLRVEIKRKSGSGGGSSGTIGSNRAKAILTFKNKTIATFNSVRCTMDSDANIAVEELVKRIKVPVSRGFDHLKLIRNGGDYKLSLSNQRGNQFFEHKKYDNFYANIPDEAKTLKPSIIVSEKTINWQELNTRCGFWACFQLKQGELDASPEVINTRDKQAIGHVNPAVAYFEYASFILHNGREETRFTLPYLDKIAGQFYIVDSTSGSKRVQVELSILDVSDKASFINMIETAFP